MNKLLRHIHEHSLDSLHSGLIVGAGNGSQLSDWRQLGCRHLLLAEAHPDQAEELGRRLRHEQGELLLALAVTADEQPMAMLQPLNNLAYSSLNTAIDLFAHYPNLRSGEAMQVPARSLGRLLAEQELDEQQPHLLLIAAPGQAMQLLQGTPATVLQAFTWLLIECSSEPLYQGDADASEISTWLQGLGYDLVSDDPDAIYPQSQLLFKRNPSVVERLRLSSEILELRSQLVHAAQSSQQQIAALQQQLQQCDATLVEQTRLANERQTQIDSLAKEHAELTATHDALGKDKIALGLAHDEQTKLASERQAQIDTLGKEKADLASARDALAKEKTELTKARDEQAKLASERQAQIDTLGKEKVDLISARDALAKEKTELTKARDEQAKLASDRQAKIDTLGKEKADLASVRDALAKEKSELTKARDEHAKLASERQAKIDALDKEKADLAAVGDALAKEKSELTKAHDEQAKLASERQAQIDTLGKEKADLASARDALTKEKTELTKARDEQTKLASDRQAKIDALDKEKSDLATARDALASEKTELTKARDEQTKLASERKAQLDKITAERDQVQKSVAEQKKTFDNAQLQIKTLENEASESLNRQQLLQEELIKAEAQIELIKDLLLREPGL
jgi:chromosome segregation ATPase